MEAFEPSLSPSFPGSVFFVTLRLQNALPESFVQNLGLQFYTKQVFSAQHPQASDRLHKTRKALFARFEETLNLCKYGQHQFQVPVVAEIVKNSLQGFQSPGYKLLDFSIQPNHLKWLFQFSATTLDPILLEDFDQLMHHDLRRLIQKFQSETELALKLVLEQLAPDPAVFQKRNPGTLPLKENSFWHPRSFDFQIQNAAEFEKVSLFIARQSIAGIA